MIGQNIPHVLISDPCLHKNFKTNPHNFFEFYRFELSVVKSLSGLYITLPSYFIAPKAYNSWYPTKIRFPLTSHYYTAPDLIYSYLIPYSISLSKGVWCAPTGSISVCLSTNTWCWGEIPLLGQSPVTSSVTTQSYPLAVFDSTHTLGTFKLVTPCDLEPWVMILCRYI